MEDTTMQPDPTPVTSARILREVSSLEALMDEKIANVREQIKSLGAAQALFHEDLTRVPTAVDKAVAGLKELLETRIEDSHKTVLEKFYSIDKQFDLRDDRVKQTALDTKSELAAALAAQEKAVGKQNEANVQATNKSEETFGKQIDQQRQLLEVNTRALNDKIDALKDMVLRGEGKDVGKSISQGTGFAIIGALLGIASLVTVLIKM